MISRVVVKVRSDDVIVVGCLVCSPEFVFISCRIILTFRILFFFRKKCRATMRTRPSDYLIVTLFSQGNDVVMLLLVFCGRGL
ncbi:MAG: hypothetical protein Q9183_007975, partial [Haloplaca sp. 2 TL-2023]